MYIERMANVNIYLPDEIAKAARTAGLNVSATARGAIERELAGPAALRPHDELYEMEINHPIIPAPPGVYVRMETTRDGEPDLVEHVPVYAWDSWSAPVSRYFAEIHHKTD